MRDRRFCERHSRSRRSDRRLERERSRSKPLPRKELQSTQTKALQIWLGWPRERCEAMERAMLGFSPVRSPVREREIEIQTSSEKGPPKHAKTKAQIDGDLSFVGDLAGATLELGWPRERCEAMERAMLGFSATMRTNHRRRRVRSSSFGFGFGFWLGRRWRLGMSGEDLKSGGRRSGLEIRVLMGGKMVFWRWWWWLLLR